ncbi:MAG: polyprenyl diphosphate synthase [Candidatus Parcubacteria bacterium]|nr:polyprenyl diphosphate synthase [Candidatus Parcubacteria bacterium]
MDKNNIPRHIAIIMDGNRRWAKRKGLSSTEGHRRGYEQFKKISDCCNKLGVKILTVYAFSSENWKRSRTEVFYLMNLLKRGLKEQKDIFIKNKVRLNVIGQIEKLPFGLKKLVLKIMKETKDNKERILNLAISYGGREEIIEAVKKIIKNKISSDKINEKIFSQHLYTAGQPDPDIIIRTSGEQRLSGFLPWQSVYAELYFSPKFWPDFTGDDLEEIIKDFQNRQRRFGK